MPQMSTNTETWGNIELPGLSDEKLFKKNWNRSQAQKDYYNNLNEEEKIKWRDKLKKLWQNPEYVERMRAFYSSPEQIEKHTKQVREVALRKDWREKVEKLNRDKRKNPFHIEKHQSAVDKRTQDPEWRRKQAERAKPMITPDGIFASRKEAAEFYQVKTPAMNFKIKKYPDQYYYITQEEYIMLTGKDI